MSTLKNREHLMNNVLSFATFEPLTIRPASHPCVLLSSVAGLPVPLSPTALCVLRAPGLQVHSLSAHYRWAQEGARISPSSWLIKTFSCSPPSSPLPLLPPPPPSASYGCSHHADHTNQALIYSIYTILLSPLWQQGI